MLLISFVPFASPPLYIGYSLFIYGFEEAVAGPKDTTCKYGVWSHRVQRVPQNVSLKDVATLALQRGAFSASGMLIL